MTLPGGLDGADDDQGATGKGVGVAVHQAPRARVGMRHEAGEQAPRVKPVPGGFERGPHLRRMMRVVIDQRDAPHLAADFKAS